MRRVGMTLLLWAVVCCANAQVRVGGGKIMDLPDGTQISFRLSGPVQYESFILNNPPRFVVDIANARVDDSGIATRLGSADVRGVRTGVRNGNNLRLVVDLAAFVHSKSTLVHREGHHLVVDVFRRQPISPEIARVDVTTRPVRMISTPAATTPPAPDLGGPRLTQRSTTPETPVTLASRRPAVAPEPQPVVRPAVQRQVVQAQVPVPRPRPEVPTPEVTSPGALGNLMAIFGGGNRRPASDAAAIPVRAAAATAPVASRSRPSRERVVIIDPGHGGKDPGAIGPGGTYEKTVVLAIAQRLRDLINAQPGMRAVMTRDDDRFIRLYDRIAIARREQADLFLSIHADAIAGNPRAGGSSVYILSTSGASSARARYLARRENEAFVIGGDDLRGTDASLNEVVFDIFHDAVLADSMELAESIIDELSRVGRVHRRQVERAGFAVLKSPDIPSVLVETAFISNPSEERNLKTREFQQRVAEGILRGVKGFLQNRPSQEEDDRQFAGGNRANDQVHVIQPGESLSTIAARYRVPVSRLRSANNLPSDRVMAGTSLTIPFTLSGS